MIHGHKLEWTIKYPICLSPKLMHGGGDKSQVPVGMDPNSIHCHSYDKSNIRNSGECPNAFFCYLSRGDISNVYGV